MLLPSIFSFNDDPFTNVFDDMFDRIHDIGKYAPSFPSTMKTDVKDNGETYELGIEIPGFKKEDVKIELDGGQLTISAETKKEDDEKDEKGKYIRRERYVGKLTRTFSVGDNVKPEDISAKFEDGILKLDIKKPQIEAKETKLIEIH